MSVKSAAKDNQGLSKQAMEISKKTILATMLLAGVGLQSVLAQDEPQTMPDMDHGAMPGMNHDAMQEPSMSMESGHDMRHAEEHSDSGMEPMDHNAMHGQQQDSMHGAMHDTNKAMDHGAAMPAGHGAMSDGMAGMNHGAMQGGSAPADARDPHAYSGGYTLTSGPYDLQGPRQLKLADEHNFGSLLVDRLEAARNADDASAAYDLQAWYGRDYNRAVFKAEGDYNNSDLEESSIELLWGHAVDAYWDTQLGVRHDSGEGADRSWLAFGIQGLAPYWFEVDASAYIGEQGHTALNIEAEYELMLTQKLILQPRVEVDFHGQSDSERGIGSGLSEAKAGMRLRYEIRREFAPYVGVEWAGLFGETADYAGDAGLDANETQAVAGIRFWF